MLLRSVGEIDRDSIVVPDSVAMNTTLGVAFDTLGGCGGRAGYTQVSIIDSRTAEIRPFDDVQVNPQGNGNLIELIYQHFGTMQFEQAGNATVRLVGAAGDSTITIARTQERRREETERREEIPAEGIEGWLRRRLA